MSIINQIKTMFVLSCPNCGARFNQDMRERYELGYNCTCYNCEVYIENERF